MATKKKSTQKSRVKVGKLKVNKETKDVNRGEATKVKGGQCSTTRTMHVH